MTEKEARLILDVRISRFDHANDVNIALEIAKNAIDEIQQYRNLGKIEFLTNMKSNYVEVLSELRQYQKIGTVEECREAREMTRRYCEPEYSGKNTDIRCRIGECKYRNIIRSYQKFCDKNGIRTEWSEVGE